MRSAAADPESPARRRVRAFSLEIDTAIDAPGLPVATGEPVGPRMRLDVADASAIDARWPRSGVERVLEERFDDGPPARTIDVHPDAGYRLYARHFGLAWISPSGDRVVCAPPDEEAWSWQRFLVGRILPWTAVLRGNEAFHASAVAIDGGARAFGKTSIAFQLVRLGARFVTDDVLVVDRPHGGVRAHPGASIASLRAAERALIPQDALAQLGELLGDSDKTYIGLPRVEGPLPLEALYILERGQGSAIEPLGRVEPPLLLGNTFVLGVRSKARLLNQLDVCAAIARDVPVFRLRAAPGTTAEGLAALVHAHDVAGARA
jgi:hypothetical protein